MQKYLQNALNTIFNIFELIRPKKIVFKNPELLANKMNLFGNYKFNNIIMKSIMFFLIVNLFAISVKSQVIKGSFKEGEVYLTLNEINHWVKIKGLENKTMPIIILHGGPGGNNYVFEGTIGPLLEEFATIVYYEQRGCGRSYAAKDTNDYMMLTLINDLDELIETLGVEKVSLLGYSFGAELALRFTKQHPEKVNKLILSAPAELSTSTNLIQIQGFYSIANNDNCQMVGYIESV